MRPRRVCVPVVVDVSLQQLIAKKYSRMPIFHLNSLSDPGVEVYSALTEAQLRSKVDPSRGVFIAESPKVIHVALDAGYEVHLSKPIELNKLVSVIAKVSRRR